MSSEIIIALLSLVGTLVGAYLANRKSAALVAYRLEQLEGKVNKHNNLVERMAVADQLGNRGMFAHGSAITTLHGRPHPASCDLIRQRPDRIHGV